MIDSTLVNIDSLKVAEFGVLKSSKELLKKIAFELEPYECFSEDDYVFRYLSAEIDLDKMDKYFSELSEEISIEPRGMIGNSENHYKRFLSRYLRVINRWISLLEGGGRSLTVMFLTNALDFSPRFESIKSIHLMAKDDCSCGDQQLLSFINGLRHKKRNFSDLLEFRNFDRTNPFNDSDHDQLFRFIGRRKNNGEALNVSVNDRTAYSLGFLGVIISLRSEYFTIDDIVIQLKMFSGKNIVLKYSVFSNHLHEDYNFTTIRPYFVGLEEEYEIIRYLTIHAIFQFITGEFVEKVDVDPSEVAQSDTGLICDVHIENDLSDVTDVVHCEIESTTELNNSLKQVAIKKTCKVSLKTVKMRKAIATFERLGCIVTHGSNHVIIEYDGMRRSIGGMHMKNERIVAGACRKTCAKFGIPFEDFVNALR